MKAIRARACAPGAVTLYIGLLVGLTVLGARNLRALEFLELAAYDVFAGLLSGREVAATDIALVPVSEADIQQLGHWPLTDAMMTDILDRLAVHRPRAIGIDIFRDVPVPPGTERLQAALQRYPHVVATFKFGDSEHEGVRAPAALQGTDRIGFNDFLIDRDGVVRRGLLFLDDGATVTYAFALRLALLALRAEGVVPTPDPKDPQLLRLGRGTIRPLEPNDGGYVRSDARGYQFLLDFRLGRPRFASVALSRVLAGTVVDAEVRDKVLIIGVAAESVKDRFSMPTGDDGGISGIALHGQVVQHLLRIAREGESPMRSPREWQEGLWILAWSAAGALVALRIRSAWGFMALSAGGVLTIGLIDLAAFVRGWWLPLVPVVLAWVASTSVITAHALYREKVERGVLMQLFSRHVDEQVAELIWRQRHEFTDGGRPRPLRVVATVLFTDLTGFTTVSEKGTPEALLDWLNEYMDAMAQEIARHGGVIRQFAGDSIVVTWGVPLVRTTEAEITADAVAATECALAMERSLLALNHRWRAEGRPTTGMRIGILTGPMVVGVLGSGRRSEYVSVGDTMNTASRLESFDKELFPPDNLTRPCRILVGESTVRYLGDEFEREWVGAVRLKGKEQTVNVYRVLGRAVAGAGVATEVSS